MKIAIANDHGGVTLKNTIVTMLEDQGHKVINLGTDEESSVDYPDYAFRVSQHILNGEADLGILVCGTGIGMSMAANRMNGIRAAVVTDVFSAKATKEHNDANVLCLGARVTGEGLALMIVGTWITASFQGGRHQQRIDKLNVGGN